MTAKVNKRKFEAFQLDVGLDVIVTPVELHQAEDTLGFCGIAAPTIRMIAIEQQIAEKVHAYTLPREGNGNNRVKDLVDMVLLPAVRPIKHDVAKHCLHRVFSLRKTHELPQVLSPAPDHWNEPFRAMAKECGLNLTMDHAHERVSALYLDILSST